MTKYEQMGMYAALLKLIETGNVDAAKDVLITVLREMGIREQDEKSKKDDSPPWEE